MSTGQTSSSFGVAWDSALAPTTQPVHPALTACMHGSAPSATHVSDFPRPPSSWPPGASHPKIFLFVSVRSVDLSGTSVTDRWEVPGCATPPDTMRLLTTSTDRACASVLPVTPIATYTATPGCTAFARCTGSSNWSLSLVSSCWSLVFFF